MNTESFVNRHIGPNESEISEMLKSLGTSSLQDLIENTVPKKIRSLHPLSEKIIGPGVSEYEMLSSLRQQMSKNRIYKSYLGMGYSGCITPSVIQRGILENPGWYTQYTPYQAEIAQGRLEALLNFQTMIIDLTGLEIANASLLDEATAAAEAMSLCYNVQGKDLTRSFFVSELCHPQTIAVVKTRAETFGIKINVGDHLSFQWDKTPVFAALFQYPATDGAVYDYTGLIEKLHASNTLTILATDLLGLALLKSPGEMGADVAVGNSQRFGVPLGFGGPHAAFLSTKDAYKRLISGRIVGVSKDTEGKPAIRLSLQTREQHIRREKATSNICTAQVLLAVAASMYAVYHGPNGIRKIAEKVHFLTSLFLSGLKKLGYKTSDPPLFDTVCVETEKAQELLALALNHKINLRSFSKNKLGISFDETTSQSDIKELLEIFSLNKPLPFSLADLEKNLSLQIPDVLRRKTKYLTHSVFNSYHSETQMMRYMTRLQSKDLSLTTSMIALGSCTMKLNAATEMLPITWPEINGLHPFIPLEQAKGYLELITDLEKMLAEITGFQATSLQPNAGSQGEYAGLLAIRKYHQANGNSKRDVCLIPQSAHGTNPASAAMAGMKVVVVRCDSEGNIDIADLDKKAAEYKDTLSALMITYPSTHGVYEEGIVEICEIVHRQGGQVYMDGANLNAQVGLCRPAELGADVCHLNLHKTFCIPHGGGGPGMGPIAVKSHLAPFLPTHFLTSTTNKNGVGSVSAAPWGSSSILPISYSYIKMMGALGLKNATEIAILNANYIARKLDPYFPVLYKGKNGFVAHECIVDLRQFKVSTGIEVEDVAKRLMDYSFHAPTVSFPVPGTLMIEPTESESKKELDRFCDAMISIYHEIKEIEESKADRQNNVLKNAPHTAEQVTRSTWNRPYSREKAAYPISWLKEHKFWSPVSRIDAVYGERNLVCSCPPLESDSESYTG